MCVSVPIVFAIRLVMSVDVTDRVQQREPVVCGYEVDTRCRAATAGLENIGRPVQAPRQYAALAMVATPELPHTVAIVVVPLGPPRRKITQLIATGTRVPGLCYQLGVCEPGVVADIE